MRPYKERLAYGLAAALLVVSIGATSTGAVLLRKSANNQRQEFRLQELDHAIAERSGVAVALARVELHDAAAGRRLRAVAPKRLDAAVSAELVRLAEAQRDRYPYARWTLVGAAFAFVLLTGVLIWLFELQRRAGRIDRDNARVRDEFVAVVSHELRTPLTSILGYIEMIGETDIDEEQRAYFDVVKRNANRLLYLVSDLLLVAESDGGLRLDLRDLDLEELVADSVEAGRVAADARRIELTSSAQPARLEGDALRLAQVLDNLLSNAIKYTPEGGRVVVTAWVRDGIAWLEVTDSGVGISAADRQQIFERFYRVRGSAAGGAGLGLAITKAIVEAHGGTISVESELGAGTSFRVGLPCTQVAAEAESTNSSRFPHGSAA
jgi:signal transduction histidine kinase